MGRHIFGKWVITITLLGILASSPLMAADFDYAQFNRECGLRLAYGKSTRKANVKLFTFLPRYGFFLVRPGQSFGGIGVSLVLEGTISIVDAEDTGSEFGLTPLLKLSLPLGSKVLLFAEGGVGPILENFNSPAVASTFNFASQVGGGVDIALTRKLALSLAYRFRHSSNAGLYDENSSFNVNLFQVGLLYYH
jgi:opacity protein-like surface antigen